MEKLSLFHFGAIYIDPPWNFEPYADSGAGKNATRHYDCMSINEIKELPIGHFASKNCVLFMWVTDPMLKRGIEVMAHWGFEYKTVAFTWVKLNKRWQNILLKMIKLTGIPLLERLFFMGTGYWTRANPEMCLLGVNGHPVRRNCGVRQLIIEPIREHSRKPERIYSDIEKLVDGPYLELFARKKHPSWDSWGNETNKFEAVK